MFVIPAPVGEQVFVVTVTVAEHNVDPSIPESLSRYEYLVRAKLLELVKLAARQRTLYMPHERDIPVLWKEGPGPSEMAEESEQVEAHIRPRTLQPDIQYTHCEARLVA